ncbi:glycoside hydrolase family 108 protein [Methylobacterium oryzisoli]|uniref:glycoside hydrolase family 108 protein n=1 Tax=Methylobacterium oryzisoli TaxID=3385502 RepID=UPI0038926B55
MASHSFDRSLKLVLVHEGGYSNHPKDPGGSTQNGVTQATYDDYRKKSGKPAQDVRKIDYTEIYQLYKRNYWDRIQGDDLPAGVDYAVFDWAVNSGPKRAIIGLQRVVGVADDGKLGPITLAAVRGMDQAAIVNRLNDDRLTFFRQLSTWPTFGKGWSNRVAGVRKEALAMIRVPVVPPVVIAPLPAPSLQPMAPNAGRPPVPPSGPLQAELQGAGTGFVSWFKRTFGGKAV